MNHFRVTLQYSTMSNSEAIDLTASQPEVTSDLHILIPLSILNILPNRHLSIADFLNVNLPSQSSALILQKASSAFRQAPPEYPTPQNIMDYTMPPTKWLADLDMQLRKKAATGAQSFENPFLKGLRTLLSDGKTHCSHRQCCEPTTGATSAWRCRG